MVIGLFGAVFMGFVNFFTAAVSKSISPATAIWGPAVVFSVITILYLARKGRLKKMVVAVQAHPLLVAGAGVIDTLAWTLFAVALAGNPVSITTAITESYPAVAMALGFWFNREKIKGHQFMGAGLALGSSILLGMSV